MKWIVKTREIPTFAHSWKHQTFYIYCFWYFFIPFNILRFCSIPFCCSWLKAKKIAFKNLSHFSSNSKNKLWAYFAFNNFCAPTKTFKLIKLYLAQEYVCLYGWTIRATCISCFMKKFLLFWQKENKFDGNENIFRIERRISNFHVHSYQHK